MIHSSIEVSLNGFVGRFNFYVKRDDVRCQFLDRLARLIRIARFADHLILLRQGEVLAEGPPNDILRRPEIAQTYGVDIHIATGPKEDLVVHAYSHA